MAYKLYWICTFSMYGNFYLRWYSSRGGRQHRNSLFIIMNQRTDKSSDKDTENWYMYIQSTCDMQHLGFDIYIYIYIHFQRRSFVYQCRRLQSIFVDACTFNIVDRITTQTMWLTEHWFRLGTIDNIIDTWLSIEIWTEWYEWNWNSSICAIASHIQVLTRALPVVVWNFVQTHRTFY